MVPCASVFAEQKPGHCFDAVIQVFLLFFLGWQWRELWLSVVFPSNVAQIYPVRGASSGEFGWWGRVEGGGEGGAAVTIRSWIRRCRV